MALTSAPDIAVFWFGGNDAKPQNWTTHKGEFIGDYEDLLHMFQSMHAAASAHFYFQVDGHS